ncbi:MAG: cytochrome oxidase Cbb3 [Ramlibacter sp.]|nr:cytochrome oxidase Cbb3 [Ramlibacter sp.]
MKWMARRAALRALCTGAWMAAALSPAAAQPADMQPSAEKGRQLYGSFCARCHGLNMVTPGSAFFDLRTITADQQERFERSVNQGLRAMPAWGGILKPGDVQSLWLYVMAGR